MSDVARIIEIDHIVLTDVGVAPDRAPSLRGLIEAELQRGLERGFPDAPAETVTVAVPPVQRSGPSERHLARGIARRIVHAVGGGET